MIFMNHYPTGGLWNIHVITGKTVVHGRERERDIYIIIYPTSEWESETNESLTLHVLTLFPKMPALLDGD